MLIFFYGGSWESGRKEDYSFAALAFAGQGFLTILPDYRLTSTAAYPAFLQDAAAAVGWAHQNAARFGGAPACLVLVGHSAGAYNTAMLALDERWLGGDGAPRDIVRGWAGLAGPYDFLPLAPGAGMRTFGAVNDLASTQPITFAGPGDPPAFLATGSADEIVQPRNSLSLAARLTAAGVRTQTRLYPEVGHVDLLLALSRPLRGRSSVLSDATAFLHEAVAQSDCMPTPHVAARSQSAPE